MYNFQVDYFIHINLRETITFIMNETMTPEVTTHFTWWGNKNKRQLVDTKLMYTIFREYIYFTSIFLVLFTLMYFALFISHFFVSFVLF